MQGKRAPKAAHADLDALLDDTREGACYTALSLHEAIVRTNLCFASACLSCEPPTRMGVWLGIGVVPWCGGFDSNSGYVGCIVPSLLRPADHQHVRAGRACAPSLRPDGPLALKELSGHGMSIRSQATVLAFS